MAPIPSADTVWSLENAVRNGKLNRIKKLVTVRGIRLDQPDATSGLFPLHVASKFNHADVVRYLLESGVPPDPVSRTGGLTPLHLASAAGSLPVVRTLLEHGADKEIRTSTGLTAEQLAAGAGSNETAELLSRWISPWDVVYAGVAAAPPSTRRPGDSEAIWLQQRALAQKERVFGAEHAGLITTLRRLGQLYREDGRLGEAEDALRRMHGVAEFNYSALHPEMGASAGSLGELLYAAGKLGEAETLLLQALKISEHCANEAEALALSGGGEDLAEGGGGQDVEAARKALRVALENLAHVYHAQGRFDAAQPLLSRALAMTEEVLRDPDHPQLARLLAFRGLGLLELRDFGGAKAHYARALAIVDKHLGPYHLDVARSLDNLARVFYEQGRPVEAEALFRRGVRIRERLLGGRVDDPDVMAARNNVAVCVLARKAKLRSKGGAGRRRSARRGERGAKAQQHR